MHQGLFSVTSLVIAIIYLSRFKEATRVSLHTYTWRLLFLTALLVADKANEDRPIKNESLIKLFPIVNAEELNRLELIMLKKLKFSLFVRFELFQSFMDKLLNEVVSVEISSLVNCSDFTTQLILPSMPTVPCTPEPVEAIVSSFSKSRRHQDSSGFIPVVMGKRHVSATPRITIQNLMDSNKLKERVPSHSSFEFRVDTSRRSRSRSASMKRSPSTSLFDDSSLDYSHSSSRRVSSSSRVPQVPPPPLFEPVKYQGHPRRFSMGRVIRESPQEVPHSLQARSRVLSPGYKKVPNTSPANRHTSGGKRWNSLF